jgi:hypothetical protein
MTRHCWRPPCDGSSNSRVPPHTPPSAKPLGRCNECGGLTSTDYIPNWGKNYIGVSREVIKGRISQKPWGPPAKIGRYNMLYLFKQRELRNSMAELWQRISRRILIQMTSALEDSEIYQTITLCPNVALGYYVAFPEKEGERAFRKMYLLRITRRV